MLVSVIVPTRNRAAAVGGALAPLARQEAGSGPYEVIVVDNGSTDATRRVAEDARTALPGLHYAYEARPGLHRGRHRGMREAKGDLLAFIDDDVEVSPGWIASLREALRDDSVAMVGGNILPAFVDTPPPWLLRLWRRPYGDGHAIPSLSVLAWRGEARDIDPALVWGCNLSVRRSVLEAARGFHPDAMPDDLIKFRGDGEMQLGRFVVASGARCLFHPGASVRHLVPLQRMTFDYFRRRAFLQGISDSFARLRQANLGDTPASAADCAPLHIGRALFRIAGAFTTAGRHIARLERTMAEGHAQGMRFHREKFETDPEVRAWVLRADYLED